MSADLFLERLRTLEPGDWVRLDRLARFHGVGGAAWDEAWEAAAGGHTRAQGAFELARHRGASASAGAATAGAAAALAVGDSLEAGTFDILWRPLADLGAEEGGRRVESPVARSRGAARRRRSCAAIARIVRAAGRGRRAALAR